MQKLAVVEIANNRPIDIVFDENTVAHLYIICGAEIFHDPLQSIHKLFNRYRQIRQPIWFKNIFFA
ncbi:hypothetical protein EMIT0111MI5_90255 [Burkholderia sp. IT-111MI5]